MRILFVILALIVLTSCTALAERDARIYAERARQESARNEAESRAYTEGLRNQCRAIGYAPDTEGFRQCVMTLHLQKQQEMANIRGAIIQQEIQRQTPPMPKCIDGPLGEYRRRQGQCY